MFIVLMRTHFGGSVHLDVDVADDGNAVVVSAELDLAVEPKEIRVRIEEGDGRRLDSAEINRARAPVLHGETIKLPKVSKSQYRIVGYFQ